jgi:Leucine-rich repeat (LRR) protein
MCSFVKGACSAIPFLRKRSQTCNQLGKKMWTSVRVAFGNVANFFAAIPRGVVNTCTDLKNRLVKIVHIVCVRIRNVWMKTQPGIPLLASWSFNALDRHQTHPSMGRMVMVDEAVSHCFKMLIEDYSQKDPSMLHHLGLPNHPSTKIDHPWRKLTTLCVNTLRIPESVLQTTPLNTLLSSQFIDSYLADSSTLALKDVLCSSGNTEFTPLAALTNPSDIRDWFHTNPDVLAQVKKLDLSKQQLLVIPSEIQLFPHLNILSYRNNPLLFLPENVFQGLKSLQELYLNHTQITELPPELFRGLKSLKQLHLGMNQITKLTAELFQELHSLQQLYLDMNPIKELPENVFQELNSLQTLSLAHTQITKLPPELFRRLHSLQQLYLDHTQITELPAELFEGLPTLKELDVRNTNIRELSEQLVQKFSKITWNCV